MSSMEHTTYTPMEVEHVKIPVGDAILAGDLSCDPGCMGLVIFAHGSGSSRFSPRNRHVAQILRNAHVGTLLLDLLTNSEEAIDERTAHLRFDIDLLTRRVAAAVDWARSREDLHGLPIGLFGSSTGAAAALSAAAERPETVAAVVSRGGRPDLAGDSLGDVCAPTLLIVGGADEQVIELNERAMAHLRTDMSLKIVPGATHLFVEPGTLDQVAHLAAEWFAQHFRQ